MPSVAVFFISDSTGITAQTLGHSILSQFKGVEFNPVVIPYIDTIEKAKQVVERINNAESARLPIVFDTVINAEVNEALSSMNAQRFDVLHQYIKPLEETLMQPSTHTVGQAHGNTSDEQYKDRINAVHFAMDNDDGGRTRQYDEADVILIGVSRCGKTPTSLYLALQFGIYAANYPMTDDDLDELRLPKALQPYKDKIFGLTIDPDRLTSIRNERRANSRYASIRQCEYEVNEVESIYRRFGIPFINTTDVSVEEIAAKVLSEAGIERK